jgi:hypothetical protein
LHNNYLADDAPLLLRILFYPFAILTFFACFPAFAGVMIGFSELRAKPTNVMSVVGTLGNLVLLVGYFILVGLMWPALMGV